MALSLLLLVTGLGAIAGFLGAMFGLGGGIFLVPFFVFVLHLPFATAAGTSLIAVIATSSAVAGQNAGKGIMNFRLGMVLEIATTAGGLLGGLTATLVTEQALRRIFAAVAAFVAVLSLSRVRKRNIIEDTAIDVGVLGGRFVDHQTGREVAYRIKRLPLALVASFVAGNVSGLLGVGGGFLKVPVLNSWCGVPLRVAAATSALMIGVTAVSTAPLYYARGVLTPELTAATVIGVVAGTRLGGRVAETVRISSLKVILAIILLAISAVMYWGAR